MRYLGGYKAISMAQPNHCEGCCLSMKEVWKVSEEWSACKNCENHYKKLQNILEQQAIVTIIKDKAKWVLWVNNKVEHSVDPEAVWYNILWTDEPDMEFYGQHKSHYNWGAVTSL